MFRDTCRNGKHRKIKFGLGSDSDSDSDSDFDSDSDQLRATQLITRLVYIFVLGGAGARSGDGGIGVATGILRQRRRGSQGSLSPSSSLTNSCINQAIRPNLLSKAR